ncbi:MAG: hypothetical protein JST49_01690 [Bacteroidetes bacterium]|nr:hypothetical protein [Bacteroidota bacterium]
MGFFDWFNKGNKIGIHLVQIPNFGLQQEEDNAFHQQWISEDESLILSVNYFDIPPDLATLNNIKTVRDTYRELLTEAEGGLLQVDYINLKGYPAVRSIFKLPKQNGGVIYIGSITLPFAEHSYVIKVQAAEVGVTGMRDSSVSMQLLNSGEIEVGDNGFVGWFADPYEPSFVHGLLRNISDDEKYDAQFPNHPLSLVRNMLRKIEEEVVLGEDLKTLEPFKK